MFDAIRRRAWVPLAAVGAVIGAVAIAQAAIPDSNGTIHGCYHKNNGNLRVVDNPATCNNSETALSWSQAGPQGPTGPTGAQGPKGDTGPQGPGTSDLYASHNELDIEGGGQMDGREIVSLTNLPAGTYLIEAMVNLHVDDNPLSRCYFTDQNGEFLNNYVVVFGQRPTRGQTIWPLTAIRTFSGGPNTITVKCANDNDAHAYGEVTAIRVNPVSVKPGDQQP